MFNQVRTTQSKQAKMLQAYIERRMRLWTQIRADCPTYTEGEIEARLQQFGA
jgi:hypothetical protein